MKSFHYVTSCRGAQGADINAMRDHPDQREIGYKQMLRQCAGLLQWAREQGYDLRNNVGLTLRDDWHVSYHRSIYRGRPCYYLVWSGIEFIWQRPI